MSNTSNSSNIAVQGSITPDTNDTSPHTSHTTSSVEAGSLSTHRIHRYLAENDHPVPYNSPTHHTGGSLNKTSTTVHSMSMKLQQFDAIFHGQREVQRNT